MTAKKSCQKGSARSAKKLPLDEILVGDCVEAMNRLPAGSVDQGFGPNAKFVAQAAAPGIFNLVKDAKR